MKLFLTDGCADRVLWAVIALLIIGYSGISAAADKKPGQPTAVDQTESNIYLGTSGALAGTGAADAVSSKSVRIGKGAHPKALTGSNIPKDKFGLVDWVELVKRKIIKPRHSADQNAKEAPPLSLNVLIVTKSDFVDEVIFPHYIHTWWLDCSSCHPKLFIPARGKNIMTMAGMAEGRWCGKCHGKVAFPLTDCTRCHTSPKKKR